MVYDRKDEYIESIMRLKTWMKDEKISQTELSRKTGISQSQISKVFSGNFEFISPIFWKRLSKLDNFAYIKYGLN